MPGMEADGAGHIADSLRLQVQHLSPLDRLVLALYYGEELSIREVSLVLHEPFAEVVHSLARLRRFAARMLAPVSPPATS